MDKRKKNISKLVSRFRTCIQAGATLLTNIHLPNFFKGGIYQGNGKAVCVPGLNCYSCPAASGACPIGSFQAVVGSSKFKFSYYVTGFLILLGVLLGRFICGFLCPFGWIQDLLHKIPCKKLSTKKLKPLTYLKYVILLLTVVLLPVLVVNDVGMGDPFFCKYICPQGVLEGAIPLSAMVWVIVSLAMAVLVGILASPYIQYMFKTGQITDPSSLSILNANGMLEGANTQKVFMVLVQNMFPTVIAGLLLSAVLAAIMSTADSQLLVASSSFSSDIYNTLFNKNASEKTLLNVSRITIVVVAIIACLLALDPNSSVFEIVAHAWAGFGAAFGPVILCSLFWKRCNEYGALAGVISGGAVALLWAYVPTAIWGADNLPGIFTVYEIIPGFIVSLALIFIVSLATKAPSKEVIEEFESVKTADV